MTFLNLLLVDCKRSMFSRRGAFAIIGLLLILVLSILEETQFYAGDITYYVFVADYFNTEFIFVIFAALPGAALFCIDIENNFHRFLLTRISPIKYGISKAIACLFSAVFVILVSDFLFLGLLTFKYPIIDGGDAGTVGAFLAYYCIKSIIKGFFAGTLAVAALAISVRVTNMLVTLAIPLLLFHLINLLSKLAELPNWVNIRYLSQMNINLFHTDWQNNLYTVLFFTGLSIILGIFFTIGAKRRFRNA